MSSWRRQTENSFDAPVFSLKNTDMNAAGGVDVIVYYSCR